MFPVLRFITVVVCKGQIWAAATCKRSKVENALSKKEKQFRAHITNCTMHLGREEEVLQKMKFEA